MVPNKKTQFSTQLSYDDYHARQIILLNSILNVLKRSYEIVTHKQSLILEARWDELYEISKTQQEVGVAFNGILQELNAFEQANVAYKERVDANVSSLKHMIKSLIMNYKEIESINIKLLNDNMYVARQKVEKVFNLKPEKPSYDRELKDQNKKIWSYGPVVLDRFV